jgi:ABC-type Fe3+-hydroxamate transport system substrate-binding protein
MRVVSLLPSATEIVLAITGRAGLDGTGPVQLVGRSHECDWPPAGTPEGDLLARVPSLTAARTTFTTAAEVDAAVRGQVEVSGSLYHLDVERLRALRPDVIITQDLCAVCSIDLGTVRGAAAGMDPRPSIVSLNPETFEGVLDDVLTVGAALGMEGRATEVTVGLRERAYRAEEYVNPYEHKPSVAFLEWTDPLFIGGHWTPQLIERAGGVHPLNPSVPVEGAGPGPGPIGQTLRRAGKSVRVPEGVLAATRPEVLIVCPCGLTLEQAWAETDRLSGRGWWRDLPAVRSGRVAVVDGSQMFNRPGPRLVEGLEFLVGLLTGRGEVIPAGFPWRRWGG